MIRSLATQSLFANEHPLPVPLIFSPSQDYTPWEQSNKKLNKKGDLAGALSILGFSSWSSMVKG